MMTIRRWKMEREFSNDQPFHGSPAVEGGRLMDSLIFHGSSDRIVIPVNSVWKGEED